MDATLTTGVLLREVTQADLPIFFAQQRDSVANYMAAFTVKYPADHDAFTARWARILSDDTIQTGTILYNGQVAGHVVKFEQSGELEVSYWLGRDYWGKGLATQALSAFLRDLTMRPLYARAVKDNLASLRVLEKCGFTVCGHAKDYANARGEEVEEVILRLGANVGEEAK